MDLTKYRNLFIEEATEHLSEMSSSLLALEKDVTNAEAIDVIFRMAHGIKGMAASLEYASITEVSHRLEDRMVVIRNTGAVSTDEMALLFRGLDTLEAMVGVVRETSEAPDPDSELVTAFMAAESSSEADAPAAPKKKVLSP